MVDILKLLEGQDNCVFLESARCDAENFLSYVFLHPEKVVSTFKIDEIEACFAELDEALRDGYYVAGFLSYEAGYAFEERLTHRESFNFPLLWFGVYERPLIFNHRKGGFKRTSRKAHASIGKIIASISENSYLKAVAKIKDLIARGLTYQVNYTFKLKFSFSGSPLSLYSNLRNNQSVPYSAFIKTGRSYILSFSPELFFRKRENKICTRPMKGTAERGRDLREDSEIAAQLENCLKNRSENVMIVDLLRNDLGRISTIGSVRVPRLFNVEKYETLFQMTSDIKGRIKERDLAFDMFRYIFPSGSVTGAPKISTMQIINKLEKESRNIYTGSIGFFAPDKSGTFNVAIRTLLINNRTKKGEMGVGSGIVYDSDPRREYAECCLKADFLIKKSQEFQLIETMLWQPAKGYLLLDGHLRRLKSSAGYFNFLYKRKDILNALMKLKNNFGSDSYRVRLLLYKDGKIKLEPSLLKSVINKKPEICFSAKKTCARNPFLYHKTTNRKVYDREYKRCRRAGYYDVIFTNENGEITEGAISNVFIRKNGEFYTPPVTCGLLGGVYRRYLCSGKLPVKEKILFKEDLINAEEIYVSNSVRGLVKAHLKIC